MFHQFMEHPYMFVFFVLVLLFMLKVIVGTFKAMLSFDDVKGTAKPMNDKESFDVEFEKGESPYESINKKR